MQKAKEIAKEEKCERVELNCWSFNENAIKFYKKIGMQEQRINMEFKIKINKINHLTNTNKHSIIKPVIIWKNKYYT